MFDTSTVMFFLIGMLVPLAAYTSFNKGYKQGLWDATKKMANMLITSGYMTKEEVERLYKIKLVQKE